jgi:hypothetical protein
MKGVLIGGMVGLGRLELPTYPIHVTWTLKSSLHSVISKFEFGG